ncbi:hypothetical protein [Aeromonas salmonicida]|uniref:hypothetical protein n=1 Tax=Aeromonas salmonicida TaxID=645 RepID=UPI0010006D20|nr:hypothetical protein [Aeromonas salmonicida]RSM24951.1 hypothetical protein C5B77_19340 [Aeromonas salmonicida]
MTRHAADNNGVVIFPVKAVMTQQSILAKTSKINVNIIQLERFVEKYEGPIASGGKLDFKCIHFDECQLFYEGGFRPVVEHFTRLLVAASKIMPVYCYSATYNNKFSPVVFDTTTVFEKPMGRQMDVVQINKADNAIVRTFSRVMADTIKHYREVNGYPIICFVNSTLRASAVQKKLLDYKIKSVISSSEVNDRLGCVKELMSTSLMTGCGADVIIATSSLEAGININDDVTIITEQCESGKAFQRFGRARNNGHYVMVTGNGNKGIEPNDSSSLVISFPGSNSTVIPIPKTTMLEALDNGSCTFDDADHRLACDKYSLFSSLIERTDAAVTAVAGMNNIGYEVSDVLEAEEVDNEGVQKRGTKKLAVESKGNPQYLIDRGVQEAVAIHAIRQWECFKLQYKLYGIRSSIAPEEIYLELNATGIAFLEWVARDSLLEGRLTEYTNEMRDRIGSRKMTDEEVNKTVDLFWSAVVEDKYFDRAFSDKRKKQLFRLLVGIHYVNGAWSFESSRAWWNVPLDSTNGKRIAVRERIITESGRTLEQVCLDNNLSRLDISEMKTKAVKQLCSDGITW